MNKRWQEIEDLRATARHRERERLALIEYEKAQFRGFFRRDLREECATYCHDAHGALATFLPHTCNDAPVPGFTCGGGNDGCGGDLAVGDGDCDADADCAGTATCGDKNCDVSAEGASFASDDDCCVAGADYDGDGLMSSALVCTCPHGYMLLPEDPEDPESRQTCQRRDTCPVGEFDVTLPYKRTRLHPVCRPPNGDGHVVALKGELFYSPGFIIVGNEERIAPQVPTRCAAPYLTPFGVQSDDANTGEGCIAKVRVKTDASRQEWDAGETYHAPVTWHTTACQLYHTCHCNGRVRFGSRGRWSEPVVVFGSYVCVAATFPTKDRVQGAKGCQCEAGAAAYEATDLLLVRQKPDLFEVAEVRVYDAQNTNVALGRPVSVSANCGVTTDECHSHGRTPQESRPAHLVDDDDATFVAVAAVANSWLRIKLRPTGFPIAKIVVISSAGTPTDHPSVPSPHLFLKAALSGIEGKELVDGGLLANTRLVLRNAKWGDAGGGEDGVVSDVWSHLISRRDTHDGRGRPRRRLEFRVLPTAKVTEHIMMRINYCAAFAHEEYTVAPATDTSDTVCAPVTVRGCGKGYGFTPSTYDADGTCRGCRLSKEKYQDGDTYEHKYGLKKHSPSKPTVAWTAANVKRLTDAGFVSVPTRHDATPETGWYVRRFRAARQHTQACAKLRTCPRGTHWISKRPATINGGFLGQVKFAVSQRECTRYSTLHCGRGKYLVRPKFADSYCATCPPETWMAEERHDHLRCIDATPPCDNKGRKRTEFMAAPLNPTHHDRRCQALRICLRGTEYMTQRPTATRDRDCAAYTVCHPSNEWETKPPTPRSDRGCQPLTQCEAPDANKIQFRATPNARCVLAGRGIPHDSEDQIRLGGFYTESLCQKKCAAKVSEDQLNATHLVIRSADGNALKLEVDEVEVYNKAGLNVMRSSSATVTATSGSAAPQWSELYTSDGRPGKCVSGTVSEGSCLAVAVRQFGGKVTSNRATLGVGSWLHLPPGCSVRTAGDGDDVAVFYNRNAAGLDDGRNRAVDAAAYSATSAAATTKAACEAECAASSQCSAFSFDALPEEYTASRPASAETMARADMVLDLQVVRRATPWRKARACVTASVHAGVRTPDACARVCGMGSTFSMFPASAVGNGRRRRMISSHPCTCCNTTWADGGTPLGSRRRHGVGVQVSSSMANLYRTLAPGTNTGGFSDDAKLDARMRERWVLRPCAKILEIAAHHGYFATFADARTTCKGSQAATCVGIYDPDCDGTGPYRLCARDTSAPVAGGQQIVRQTADVATESAWRGCTLVLPTDGAKLYLDEVDDGRDAMLPAAVVLPTTASASSSSSSPPPVQLAYDVRRTYTTTKGSCNMDATWLCEAYPTSPACSVGRTYTFVEDTLSGGAVAGRLNPRDPICTGTDPKVGYPVKSSTNAQGDYACVTFSCFNVGMYLLANPAPTPPFTSAWVAWYGIAQAFKKCAEVDPFARSCTSNVAPCFIAASSTVKTRRSSVPVVRVDEPEGLAKKLCDLEPRCSGVTYFQELSKPFVTGKRPVGADAPTVETHFVLHTGTIPSGTTYQLVTSSTWAEPDAVEVNFKRLIMVGMDQQQSCAVAERKATPASVVPVTFYADADPSGNGHVTYGLDTKAGKPVQFTSASRIRLGEQWTADAWVFLQPASTSSYGHLLVDAAAADADGDPIVKAPITLWQSGQNAHQLGSLCSPLGNAHVAPFHSLGVDAAALTRLLGRWSRLTVAATLELKTIPVFFARVTYSVYRLRWYLDGAYVGDTECPMHGAMPTAWGGPSRAELVTVTHIGGFRNTHAFGKFAKLRLYATAMTQSQVTALHWGDVGTGTSSNDVVPPGGACTLLRHLPHDSWHVVPLGATWRLCLGGSSYNSECGGCPSGVARFGAGSEWAVRRGAAVKGTFTCAPAFFRSAGTFASYHALYGQRCECLNIGSRCYVASGTDGRTGHINDGSPVKLLAGDYGTAVTVAFGRMEEVARIVLHHSRSSKDLTSAVQTSSLDGATVELYKGPASSAKVWSMMLTKHMLGTDTLHGALRSPLLVNKEAAEEYPSLPRLKSDCVGFGLGPAACVLWLTRVAADTTTAAAAATEESCHVVVVGTNASEAIDGASSSSSSSSSDVVSATTQQLPRYVELKEAFKTEWAFHGCYRDVVEDKFKGIKIARREIDGWQQEVRMSVTACTSACQQRHFLVAGIQADNCLCASPRADAFDEKYTMHGKVPDAECALACWDRPWQPYCGKPGRTAIYTRTKDRVCKLARTCAAGEYEVAGPVSSSQVPDWSDLGCWVAEPPQWEPLVPGGNATECNNFDLTAAPSSFCAVYPESSLCLFREPIFDTLPAGTTLSQAWARCRADDLCTGIQEFPRLHAGRKVPVFRLLAGVLKSRAITGPPFSNFFECADNAEDRRLCASPSEGQTHGPGMRCHLASKLLPGKSPILSREILDIDLGHIFDAHNVGGQEPLLVRPTLGVLTDTLPVGGRDVFAYIGSAATGAWHGGIIAGVHHRDYAQVGRLGGTCDAGSVVRRTVSDLDGADACAALCRASAGSGSGSDSSARDTGFNATRPCVGFTFDAADGTCALRSGHIAATVPCESEPCNNGDAARNVQMLSSNSSAFTSAGLRACFEMTMRRDDNNSNNNDADASGPPSPPTAAPNPATSSSSNTTDTDNDGAEADDSTEEDDVAAPTYYDICLHATLPRPGEAQYVNGKGSWIKTTGEYYASCGGADVDGDLGIHGLAELRAQQQPGASAAVKAAEEAAFVGPSAAVGKLPEAMKNCAASADCAGFSFAPLNTTALTPLDDTGRFQELFREDGRSGSCRDAFGNALVAMPGMDKEPFDKPLSKCRDLCRRYKTCRGIQFDSTAKVMDERCRLFAIEPSRVGIKTARGSASTSRCFVFLHTLDGTTFRAQDAKSAPPTCQRPPSRELCQQAATTARVFFVGTYTPRSGETMKGKSGCLVDFAKPGFVYWVDPPTGRRRLSSSGDDAEPSEPAEAVGSQNDTIIGMSSDDDDGPLAPHVPSRPLAPHFRRRPSPRRLISYGTRRRSSSSRNTYMGGQRRRRRRAQKQMRRWAPFCPRPSDGARTVAPDIFTRHVGGCRKDTWRGQSLVDHNAWILFEVPAGVSTVAACRDACLTSPTRWHGEAVGVPKKCAAFQVTARPNPTGGTCRLAILNAHPTEPTRSDPSAAPHYDDYAHGRQTAPAADGSTPNFNKVCYARWEPYARHFLGRIVYRRNLGGGRVAAAAAAATPAATATTEFGARLSAYHKPRSLPPTRTGTGTAGFAAATLPGVVMEASPGLNGGCDVMHTELRERQVFNRSTSSSSSSGGGGDVTNATCDAACVARPWCLATLYDADEATCILHASRTYRTEPTTSRRRRAAAQCRVARTHGTVRVPQSAVATTVGSRSVSPQLCKAACGQAGYSIAGVTTTKDKDGGDGEDGTSRCFCGSPTLDDYAYQGPAPDAECNSPCTGDERQMCGAAERMNVFARSSDRHCRAVSPPCAAHEFESRAPTATSDRVCEALTTPTTAKATLVAAFAPAGFYESEPSHQLGWSWKGCYLDAELVLTAVTSLARPTTGTVDPRRTARPRSTKTAAPCERMAAQFGETFNGTCAEAELYPNGCANGTSGCVRVAGKPGEASYWLYQEAAAPYDEWCVGGQCFAEYSSSTSALVLPGAQSRRAQVLPHRVAVSRANMSVDACTHMCQDRGFDVAGLQGGDTCFCGDTDSSEDSSWVAYDHIGMARTAACDTPCTGKDFETCGGVGHNSIYVLNKDAGYRSLAPMCEAKYGLFESVAPGPARQRQCALLSHCDVRMHASLAPSTVVLPGAMPSRAATFCATAGGLCTCPAGYQILFGRDVQWHFAPTLSDGKPVRCAAASFARYADAPASGDDADESGLSACVCDPKTAVAAATSLSSRSRHWYFSSDLTCEPLGAPCNPETEYEDIDARLHSIAVLTRTTRTVAQGRQCKPLTTCPAHKFETHAPNPTAAQSKLRNRRCATLSTCRLPGCVGRPDLTTRGECVAAEGAMWDAGQHDVSGDAGDVAQQRRFTWVPRGCVAVPGGGNDGDGNALRSIFPFEDVNDIGAGSVAACTQLCARRGFTVAGLGNGRECRCGGAGRRFGGQLQMIASGHIRAVDGKYYLPTLTGTGQLLLERSSGPRPHGRGVHSTQADCDVVQAYFHGTAGNASLLQSPRGGSGSDGNSSSSINNGSTAGYGCVRVMPENAFVYVPPPPSSSGDAETSTAAAASNRNSSSSNSSTAAAAATRCTDRYRCVALLDVDRAKNHADKAMYGPWAAEGSCNLPCEAPSQPLRTKTRTTSRTSSRTDAMCAADAAQAQESRDVCGGIEHWSVWHLTQDRHCRETVEACGDPGFKEYDYRVTHHVASLCVTPLGCDDAAFDEYNASHTSLFGHDNHPPVLLITAGTTCADMAGYAPITTAADCQYFARKLHVQQGKGGGGRKANQTQVQVTTTDAMFTAPAGCFLDVAGGRGAIYFNPRVAGRRFTACGPTQACVCAPRRYCTTRAGCMDATYVEYDDEVTVSRPAACVTPVVVNPAQGITTEVPVVQGTVNVTGSLLVLAGSPHTAPKLKEVLQTAIATAYNVSYGAEVHVSSCATSSSAPDADAVVLDGTSPFDRRRVRRRLSAGGADAASSTWSYTIIDDALVRRLSTTNRTNSSTDDNAAVDMTIALRKAAASLEGSVQVAKTTAELSYANVKATPFPVKCERELFKYATCLKAAEDALDALNASADNVTVHCEAMVNYAKCYPHACCPSLVFQRTIQDRKAEAAACTPAQVAAIGTCETCSGPHRGKYDADRNRCACDPPYTGRFCDVTNATLASLPLVACTPGVSIFGTCANNATAVHTPSVGCTCACPPGWTGSLCDDAVVIPKTVAYSELLYAVAQATTHAEADSAAKVREVAATKDREREEAVSAAVQAAEAKHDGTTSSTYSSTMFMGVAFGGGILATLLFVAVAATIGRNMRRRTTRHHLERRTIPSPKPSTSTSSTPQFTNYERGQAPAAPPSAVEMTPQGASPTPRPPAPSVSRPVAPSRSSAGGGDDGGETIVVAVADAVVAPTTTTTTDNNNNNNNNNTATVRESLPDADTAAEKRWSKNKRRAPTLDEVAEAEGAEDAREPTTPPV